MSLFPIFAPTTVTPVTSTWISGAVRNNVSEDPSTFSGQNIGTASAGRKVVVGVFVNQAGGMGAYEISATLGGSAMTQLLLFRNSANNAMSIAFFSLDVSSGTSADIAISAAGGGETGGRKGIAVWDVQGAAATIHDSAGVDSTNTTTISMDCEANGTIIAVGGGYIGDASYTIGNLTKRYNAEIISGMSFHGSSDNFSAAQSGLSITANANQNENNLLAAISFSPA